MAILAYDLGTGGNKASLYDDNGTLTASVFEGYGTAYPESGFHEQKPEDWKKAVAVSTRKLLAKSGVNAENVAAIALSGHSLGCVPLDENGRLLLHSVPIWSDSRAGAQAKRFFETTDYLQWYLKTGAGFPSAHYTIFKLMWYRENMPEIFAKMKNFVGTKDFINFWLTGRVATDFSYASGTGAYSLKKREYDSEILNASELSPDIFPEIVPSTEILGSLTPEAASELGLPASVKVVAGGVDNSCMALGARAFKNGRSYASLGSSAWIAVSDEKPILDVGFFPYVFAHVVPGQFASAAAIFSAGTTLKWIKDVCCADLVAECEKSGENVYAKIISLAKDSPIGAKGLLLNPTFAGGSCLEPSAKMRGGLFNLDLSHSRADIVRAALEGVAMNLRKALDALETISKIEEPIVLVGGGAISPVWRQIYADAWRKTVEKTNIDQDAASLGAAALAAVGTGIWDSFDRIDALHQTQDLVKPKNPEAYEKILPNFLKTAEMLTELANT